MTPYELAPWLGEHESPISSLTKGVQAGSQLFSNFMQGSRLAQEQDEASVFNPLREQLMQSQVKSAAAEATTKTNMVSIMAQQQAGQAVLAHTLYEIARDGDWNNPVARAKFYKIGEMYPALPGSPIWNNTEANFIKSDKAAAESVHWQAQADIATARVGALQDQVEIARQRQALAEEKFAKTQSPGTVTYETPFANMPWIKVAHTANGGIHVIKGEQPLNATQKLEMIKERAKTSDALQYAKPGTKAHQDLTDQLNYIDETMKGAQSTAPTNAPVAAPAVDSKDPLGLFK